MANFKVVLSDPKSRKAYQKEVDQSASGLLGKKVGETVPAGPLGLEGYTIQITGGSDKDGFPMRRDVEGSARKKIILSHPPGFHPERRGQRKRKSFRGNTIATDIVQINTKILEYGKKSIEDLLGVKKAEKKDEKPKEDKKAEKPAAEVKKEEPKKEAPKEESKKEAPAEQSKEAPKEEPKKEEPKITAEEAEKKMGIKKLED